MNIRKVINFTVAAVFAATLALLPAGLPKAQAAGLSNAYATSAIAGRMNSMANIAHLVYFEVPSGITAGSVISFTYPAGFNVSTATVSYGVYPTGITQIAGQIISAAINSNVSAGGGVAAVISNITNASVAGSYTISIATPLDAGSASLNIIGDVTNFNILPSSVINTTAGSNFSITVMAMSGSDNAYTPTAVTLSAPLSGISVSSIALDPTNGAKQVTLYMTKAGSYTITASANGKSGVSNTVNVARAATSSVSISPATATLNIGQTKQYTAQAQDAYGNTWDVTNTAAWSTSNGTIAGGLYTAKNSGTHSVSVSIDGKSASAQVTVNQQQPGGNNGGNNNNQGNNQGSQDYSYAGTEETTSNVTATPTVKPTEKAVESTDVSKEVSGATTENKTSNRTVEKIVLGVVALALLGTSAYFLFKKSPEDELSVGNENDNSEIKITPAEEIIKKAEEAAKKAEAEKSGDPDKKADKK